MMQRRKRGIWREGERRSPRISANTSATTSTNSSQLHLHQKEGPASLTEAKKKRKITPLFHHHHQGSKSSDAEDVAQPSHENYQLNSEDQSILQDQQSSMPHASWIPEKRILELIIDTLQRRDTYEIFGEPVDPDEVDNYYEIIKEPMDFGTMRAKLHEEMYTNLEQFEHDVFLIPRNAMLFNSSGTIYFRQARVIDELAKRVFYVLKNDPKNFELEFSETKRRSGRRPQTEGTNQGSSLKLASNSRSNSINSSLKSRTCSTSVSSNPRRATQVNTRCSVIANRSGGRDCKIHFGAGDCGMSTSSKEDRRSTYQPWMSFPSEKYSILSSVFCNSRALMQLNQQDVGYQRSLMLFVRDLGPTAKKIALRKLNGLSVCGDHYLIPGSDSQSKAASYQNCAWMPTTLDTAAIVTSSQNVNSEREGASASNENGPCATPAEFKPIAEYKAANGPVRSEAYSSDRIETSSSHKRDRAYIGNKMPSHGISEEVSPINTKGKSPYDSSRREAHSSERMGVASVCRRDKFQQNWNSEIQMGSHPSILDGRNLKFSVAGSSSTNKSTMLMSNEKSKLDAKPKALNSFFRELESNTSECRKSDRYSFSSSSTGISSLDQSKGCFTVNVSEENGRGSIHETLAGRGTIHRVGSWETSQGSTWSPWTAGSQFKKYGLIK